MINIDYVLWDVLSKGRFVCAPGNGDVVVEPDTVYQYREHKVL